MKTTITTAILALSFHASVSAANADGRDFPKNPGLVSRSETNGWKLSSIPESGAAILGLLGAMMLLRRRVIA